MYEQHKAFETPPDACVIWRYMSFAKFAWLMAKESLYFSRLDQHTDAREGLIAASSENISHRKYIRFSKYINCWHINKCESDAMWKLYGQAGETLAVKSTVGALKASLKDSASIYIGRVNYNEGEIPDDNVYWPVTFKRKPFQHEEELRLCVSSPSGNNPPDISQIIKKLSSSGINKWSDLEILKDVGEKGRAVSVDVRQLIQQVVIGPNSCQYLHEAVDYILKSKNYDVRIDTSMIDQKNNPVT